MTASEDAISQAVAILIEQRARLQAYLADLDEALKALDTETDPATIVLRLRALRTMTQAEDD